VPKGACVSWDGQGTKWLCRDRNGGFPECDHSPAYASARPRFGDTFGKAGGPSLQRASPFRLVATQFEVSLVFNCSFSNGAGTCFCWNDSKGTFFATAAHLLRGAASGDQVRLRTADGHRNLRLTDIVFADGGVDICVFATSNFRLRWTAPIRDDSSIILQLGDDVLFLGFPHGLSNTVVGINHFVTPLARKATFSGEALVGNARTMILDGFNNPGYSGAPVFAMSDEGHLVPVAVISGYRFESVSHASVFRSVDGEEHQLPDTYVKPNSGMIYAYPWAAVLEALSRLSLRNPVLPDHAMAETRESARKLGWNVP
jgi:S1-C subfamily serine protease